MSSFRRVVSLVPLSMVHRYFVNTLLITGLLAVSSCSRVTNSVKGLQSRVSSPFTKSYSGLRTLQAATDLAEDITPDYEYRLGRAVAAQLISQYGVLDDAQKTRFTNLVGHVLATYSDRPEVFAGYHFLILDTKELNAFAAPGAFIFITRGLLESCQNEDELAAVLAHEIAHIQSKHALRSIENARLTTFLNRATLSAVTASTGLDDFGVVSIGFSETATAVSNKILSTGYSREMELDADAQAVDLLERAGYSKMALPRLLERLDAEKIARGLTFLSTHDTPQHRLEALKNSGITTATSQPSQEREDRFAHEIQNRQNALAE